VVPGLIMGVMFLMPIIGNWKLGHRFNVAFTLGIVAGAGLLTAMALHEDYYALWADRASLADAQKLYDETGGDAEKLAAALGGDEAAIAAMRAKWDSLEKIRHSQAFLEAAKQARLDAARAIELAGRPEKIPPAGMLELVRSDPKSQGPRLFALHCASCHAHADPQAPEAAGLLAKASAANLFGFGSAAWMRGLLDPEQVAGPAYFGNTAHKDGDMVSYVKDTIADADEWSREEIDAVVALMAAEAALPGMEAVDVPTLERGRNLVTDAERCGGCHAFHDNGTDYGSAPDLTGWGSREWLVGIIVDPTHERFYGDTNDRMPSFGKAPEGGLAPLTRPQIELIADWLRGEWYEPPADGRTH
jgi:mono/diheme cytochrome c family protein